MEKKKVTYTEVELESSDFSRFYHNPLTKTFQYEYALVRAVSELFATVKEKSLCLETLRLYFLELPREADFPKPEEAEGEEIAGKAKGAEAQAAKKTREKLLLKMEALVTRDVLGNISFPMMSSCAAELTVVPMEDGSHMFIFSDGVYTFSVSLELTKKGQPEKIIVRDFAA